jgi:hypothetical protein
MFIVLATGCFNLIHGRTSANRTKPGRVFNFRSGHLHAVHLWCYQVKLPNLKLKTWPRQLLGSLLLDSALPALSQCKKSTIDISTRRDITKSSSGSFHVFALTCCELKVSLHVRQEKCGVGSTARFCICGLVGSNDRHNYKTLESLKIRNKENWTKKQGFN